MAQKGELNNTHGTNNTYEEEEVKLLGVMTSMNKSMKKVFTNSLDMKILIAN
jgi:hypothetical protein